MFLYLIRSVTNEAGRVHNKTKQKLRTHIKTKQRREDDKNCGYMYEVTNIWTHSLTHLLITPELLGGTSAAVSPRSLLSLQRILLHGPPLITSVLSLDDCVPPSIHQEMYWLLLITPFFFFLFCFFDNKRNGFDQWLPTWRYLLLHMNKPGRGEHDMRDSVMDRSARLHPAGMQRLSGS